MYTSKLCAPYMRELISDVVSPAFNKQLTKRGIMEYFNFYDLTHEMHDERSFLANRICKLLYNKHNGDIDAAIKDGDLIFKGLNWAVRNIGELVLNCIPLMAYDYLIRDGADNYGFTQVEYDIAIERTKAACVEFYTEGKVHVKKASL